eukprot:Protomagalhaensia_wolfi_Nauph_80__746@NODE_1428_length_1536_cov_103_355377_g1102_i0_p2_GENE_NODE_1428_length_1536_cov_103_355377_g1102_i0NODE_1428_length_1536_cov_103_355377_g1102_i0_p2_ORF_typecomplete_len105_score26_94PepX_C/PF08530_10/0_00039_NODE_1428_length_1536_cov_103_355377_g1102_i0125439
MAVKTPTVRYSLIDFVGTNQTDIPSPTFPPPGSHPVKFYLNGPVRTLQREPPETAFPVKYVAGGIPGRASFQLVFQEDTKLVMQKSEADIYDDMDVFTMVKKLN